ncbi:chromosome segregation protein SMC, partial [Soehngenia saccharolytica]
LVRVNDILAELERQVGPLERQAEKARIYLKKKEELKTFDVNMFLLEMERIDRQLQEVKENYSIADRDYQEAKESYEQIKTEYEKLEQDMAAEDEKINAIRDEMSQSAVTKNRLESQIEILNEQIRSAEHTDEHMQSRLDAIDHEKEERISSGKTYEEEKVTLDAQISEIEEK